MARSDRASCVAVVRRLEDGFFTPDGKPFGPPVQPFPVAKQFVHQFSARRVEGIPSATQFFRVLVDVESLTGSRREVWVVCVALPTAHQPPRPGARSVAETEVDQLRPLLTRTIPGATLCFTTEDRDGFVRIVGDPEHAVEIAAAVATVKYFAAWDDSDPIIVVVNDDQLSGSLSYVSNEYRVVVTRDQPPAPEAIP